MSEAAPSAAPAGSGSIEIREATVAAFFADPGGWERLVAAAGVDPLFLGQPWVEAWWRSFSAVHGLEPVFFEAWQAGRRVGLAPFYRHRAGPPGLRGTRIELVGNIWRGPSTARSEFLDLVIDPAAGLPAARALLDRLQQDTGWQEFAPSDIAENSMLLAALPGHALSTLTTREEGRSQSYEIEVRGTFDDYVASLTESARRRLFNQRRKLESRGPVEHVIAPPGSFASFCGELDRLHALRFGSPYFSGTRRAFHAALIQALPATAPRLSLLRLAGRPVSALYNLRLGRHEYNLQAGFDPAESAGVSLAKLHWGYLIEASFQEPGLTLDLLLGEGKSTGFKQEFARPARRCRTLQMIRPGALAHAYRLYDRWLRPLRRAWR